VFSGKTIFSQIVELIHPQQFRRCAERYRGHYKLRAFSCWDQFLCMAFAQLTFREGLRDIEDCLTARPDQLYHLGFRSRVCRSTLADANEARDWRIYADLATLLIKKARRLYAGQPLEVDLQQSVYALDSTTVELCLNLFPWAHFQSSKAAIKLHTLLDLRGPIPSFIEITEGRCHDVNALERLVVEPGAFYVMDRGYLDFGRLYTLHQAGAYFIIRARKGLRFVRYCSQPIDADTGLCSDQVGRLRGFYSRKAFPDKLRLVRFYDRLQDRRFCFLSNHLRLSALTICQLYKMRWQVELFFKWIKQHLRIKRFYGHSINAVKTQVWIAVCVYTLVAILKKELQLPQSLHSILQVLSVRVFEKVPLHQLLTTTLPENYDSADRNQLRLWDL
jgi:Transposase DDE domain/Domain of unknown function (DUF4372)